MVINGNSLNNGMFQADGYTTLSNPGYPIQQKTRLTPSSKNSVPSKPVQPLESPGDTCTKRKESDMPLPILDMDLLV